MFFYEASSWEYALSIPHDVPGLIEQCGGKEKFDERLDIFFDKGFFNYNDGSAGLPGNDDSGAMSSWLVFHMMGLYPNAGQDYYLIHTPLLTESRFHLQEGKTFTIKTEGLSEKNKYIRSILLNGKNYPYSTIRHNDIIKGGELVLKMGPSPGNWGSKLFPESKE